MNILMRSYPGCYNLIEIHETWVLYNRNSYQYEEELF